MWKSKLPAGGYATPMTYELDGKQYIVIACGGGKMGTKSGILCKLIPKLVEFIY